uniref:Secreted protein n=1 Tax=Anguilla anguilla TaxID=7936 RepID=A0A0E9VD51_ANGAN
MHETASVIQSFLFLFAVVSYRKSQVGYDKGTGALLFPVVEFAAHRKTEKRLHPSLCFCSTTL